MLHHLTNDQIVAYYQLLNKLTSREDAIRIHQMDVKFAYHCVRLLDECEQILTQGDLDLQRNREQLKAIRRGEWTLEQLQVWFSDREKHLETVYENSKLPHGPDYDSARTLLLNICEHHYGRFADIPKSTKQTDLLAELEKLVDKYR